MRSHTAYLTFRTQKRKELVPITDQVERIIDESGIQEGLALVSAMHITAAVIVNDYEPGLWQDIMEWVEKVAPRKPSVSPSPHRRRQRRCPSQKFAVASPDYHPYYERALRCGPLAANLLL